MSDILSSMKYGLFGKFDAQDGKRDQLIDILLQAAELLQRNNECIEYIVGKSSKPNEVWISELWTSKEAHDSSLEPEDIRTLIMSARPYIADMPEGTEYYSLGGKGIEV